MMRHLATALAVLLLIGTQWATPARGVERPFHVQGGRQTEQEIPSGRDTPIAWDRIKRGDFPPREGSNSPGGDDWPDVWGAVSDDRTEITMPTGDHIITTTATFGPSDRGRRKGKIEKFDSDHGWIPIGDLDEVNATKGGETTINGTAWARSDGTERIRVSVWQNSGRVLGLSSEWYETQINVVRMER